MESTSDDNLPPSKRNQILTVIDSSPYQEVVNRGNTFDIEAIISKDHTKEVEIDPSKDVNGEDIPSMNNAMAEKCDTDAEKEDNAPELSKQAPENTLAD